MSESLINIYILFVEISRKLRTIRVFSTLYMIKSLDIYWWGRLYICTIYVICNYVYIILNQLASSEILIPTSRNKFIEGGKAFLLEALSLSCLNSIV
jgi:hypothetical protein